MDPKKINMLLHWGIVAAVFAIAFSTIFFINLNTTSQ